MIIKNRYNKGKITEKYELDIVKVASSLGIDQDYLLANVYMKLEPTKCSDEKDIPSDYGKGKKL